MMEKKIIVSCDLCGSSHFHLLFGDVTDTALDTPGKFSLVECVRCGLIFLNPRPAGAALGDYYPSGYDPYIIKKGLMNHVGALVLGREKKHIQQFLPRGGSLLEVGCAGGELLSLFQKDGYKVRGLEMDGGCVRAAREGYHVQIWEGRFEEFSFPAGVRFDGIIMRYVLEHLPSPKAALRTLRTLIATGGIVYLTLPNYGSWERRLFGRSWHCFDVPRHFHIFSEALIRLYAKETGFRVAAVRYDLVPNDWIGSIGRYFHEKKYMRLARFFTYKNLLLIGVFAPFGICAKLFKKSSRFAVVLRAY